jgi:thioredoxin-like negative regulator of GroEL
MIIRFALTLVIILTSLALFLALRNEQIRRANKNERVLPIGHNPSLLFFSRDSCAPCLTQDSYLDKLEPELQGKLSVEKFDVDLNRVLANQLGIFTLPTTVLVDRSGQVRHINYGLTTAAKLEGQLEKIS